MNAVPWDKCDVAMMRGNFMQCICHANLCVWFGGFVSLLLVSCVFAFLHDLIYFDLEMFAYCYSCFDFHLFKCCVDPYVSFV